MYRFHCTVCGKMKRVQHVPRIISNQDSTNVSLRIGVCDKHALPVTKTRPGSIKAKVGA